MIKAVNKIHRFLPEKLFILKSVYGSAAKLRHEQIE